MNIQPNYITTPIYYVNSTPHIGHLYTTLLADTLKRYLTTQNNHTYLLTGTDEHGQKVEQASKINNKTPIDYATILSNEFKNLFNKANISYTKFMRTTDQDHIDFVIKSWNTLIKKELIYKDYYEGWYCVADECFYTEKEVDKINKVSLISNKPIEWVKEENYKFKLSKFKDDILDFISLVNIYPKQRLNELTEYINNPQDISISRTNHKFGIQVPNDPTHIIYVWFDALLNYASQNYTPTTYHFIGKDITKFHCVIYPALLKALDIPYPKNIIIHGWWLVDNNKISKSSNNAFNLNTEIDTLTIEPLRYYLLKEGNIETDNNYDKLQVKQTYNHLIDIYGNLIMRLLSKSILKYNPINKPTQSYNTAYQTYIETTAKTIQQLYTQVKFNQVIENILLILQKLNSYIQDSKIWVLSKDNNTLLDDILYTSLEGIRIVNILLSPILPQMTTKIQNLLNYTSTSLQFNDEIFDNKINIPNGVLFTKFKI